MSGFSIRSFAREFAVYALSEHGQIAGAGPLNEERQQAYLWEDESAIPLGTLSGGTYSFAADINDASSVVGVSGVTDGASRACVWRAGGVFDLGTLGGQKSAARAMNGAGVIVGVAQTIEGEFHACRWNADEPHDLQTLGGRRSEASDINAAGQIVGMAQLSSGQGRAVLWQADGYVREILPQVRHVYSAAHAINDLDWIVGDYSFPSRDHHQGFLYDGQSTHPLPGLRGFPRSFPRAINNRGRIVGQATTGSSFEEGRAVLWSDGEIQDLNNFLSPASGWVLWDAVDINTLGQIIGLGSYLGITHTFIMSPLNT